MQQVFEYIININTRLNNNKILKINKMNTSKHDLELLEKLSKTRDSFFNEIGKVVIGQKTILNHIFIALLSKGHSLLIGVPGLAKTLLVQTLSEILGLSFKRIQFTPDLMPSDITGTELIDIDQNTGQRSFRFHKGPIFANLVLADEINRTPPKTQAALLEAMQENKVTAGGKTFNLESPFFAESISYLADSKSLNDLFEFSNELNTLIDGLVKGVNLNNKLQIKALLSSY